MDKAVIGCFTDSAAASRAMNDLKANGFGGENLHNILRDDVGRDGRYRGTAVTPGMEIIKGIILGIITGGILGIVAYKLLGLSLSSPYLLPSAGFSQAAEWTVVSMGVVGGVAGLIEGLFAIGPLAQAAGALRRHRRGDALVAVHTDEAHSARAADIMWTAGAWDVRRGASSVAGEFQTVGTVQPETYGQPAVLRREEVEGPGAPDTLHSEPDGGTVG